MKNSNIHRYLFKMKPKEKRSFFIFSDVHYDSRKCVRKMLKSHFDQAMEENGLILIIGDWLDVMGMKKDPRSLPNEIRPEYMQPDESYLDAVIDDSYEFLKPYAKNIIMFGYGNHETNIIKRQQTDPLKRLCKMLKNDLHPDFCLGSYQGAIKLTFENHGRRNSSLWKYHHGFGGGARRSKGILNADILVAQNPFADVFISGHDHNKWYLPYNVKTMNRSFTKFIKKHIAILRTGSYKAKSDDFGWEVQLNFNEPTLGGWKIEYSWTDNTTSELRKTISELN